MFCFRLPLFAVILSLVLATSVSKAEEANYKWSLGGGVGQAFPTGPATFFNAEKQKLHGSIWARYFFSQSWGVELNYNALNFASRTSANDPHAEAPSLNLVQRCTSRGRWTPVTALGLGSATITDYGSQNHSELFALLRTGVEYDLFPQLSVGGHAQLSYLPAASSSSVSEMHALSYLISLNYAFGASAPAASEPAPAPVVEAKKEVPAVVVPKIVDSDGDGVPDEMDKCPNTPAGEKVNAYGCSDSQIAQVTLDVEFAAGKADLAPEKKSQIENLAKFMKENPEVTVVVEGHTDNTGKEAGNKKISAARAEAVRQSLIKDFSIDAKRVKAQGFGSSKPIAPNTTAEGRQKNRRVVATISDKKAK